MVPAVALPATSPGSKWVAFNVIAAHLDYGRRYTTRTNDRGRDRERADVIESELRSVRHIESPLPQLMKERE